MAQPTRRLLLARTACALGVPLLMPAAQAQAQAVPTIAAAANLKFAIEELAEMHRQRTGQSVRLVLGSSGNFYSQIMQGAPFHIFLSADEAFVFRLADAGRTQDRGRVYAQGRIGIMVPKGSPLKADPELKDLAAALRDGRLQRFAIASPEHAPYGQLARQALQHAGLWESILPRLVYGENVSQAAQFATSGATQGGIIAYSLAISPTLAPLGDFALIPQEWHQPLLQRMVLLRNAPPEARVFYDFLASPDAWAVFQRHGFGVPVR